MSWTDEPPVSPEDVIRQHLTTAGDGTGDVNMTGDYSVTPSEFRIVNSSTDDVYYISRMLWYLEDNGTIAVERYGNIASGLTNGIQIAVHDADDVDVHVLTSGRAIKTNGDWSSQCFDAEWKTEGSGPNAISVRWTFTKANPGGVILRPGWGLHATMNDDMTTLIEHRARVEGYKRRT